MCSVSCSEEQLAVRLGHIHRQWWVDIPQSSIDSFRLNELMRPAPLVQRSPHCVVRRERRRSCLHARPALQTAPGDARRAAQDVPHELFGQREQRGGLLVLNWSPRAIPVRARSAACVVAFPATRRPLAPESRDGTRGARSAPSAAPQDRRRPRHRLPRPPRAPRGTAIRKDRRPRSGTARFCPSKASCARSTGASAPSLRDGHHVSRTSSISGSRRRHRPSRARARARGAPTRSSSSPLAALRVATLINSLLWTPRTAVHQ